VGIRGALVPDWFWYTVMSIITGSIIDNTALEK